jgi:Zn-dependent peptidase ImmA (M78 family)
MGTRWERLAGDTSEFALRLAFAPDPDDGQAAEPEVSMSWGSFQLWVEGRNLCAHQEHGERTESVHWYLLPLMEWFAENWNPLLHEERLPARNEGDTAWASLLATRFPPWAIQDDTRRASRWESAWQKWWQRHAIRAASEGGLFPDVVLRRIRDRVEISWGQTRTEGMPDHFDFSESERGYSRLEPQRIARPLYDVLVSASEYLKSLSPKSRRFRKLHRQILAVKSVEEHREQRLMWLAGLGTDEKSIRAGWRRVTSYLAGYAGSARRAILEPLESPLVVTGSCHASLMFGSVSPNIEKRDVVELARLMIDLHAPRGGPSAIDDARRSVPLKEAATPPWYQGYELAESLHDGLDPEFMEGESVDIERIIEKQGVKIVYRQLSDGTIRGVALDGERHRPGILVNSRNIANAHPFGRRFTLAHELCHLLFDREVGAHLAIASGPWAPHDVERRANAFAAMFLMPNELVRRAISALAGSLETKDAVQSVANRLRTGFEATLWHLKNLGYIDDVTRQRIENEALQPQPEGTDETTELRAEHVAVATVPRGRRVRAKR